MRSTREIVIDRPTVLRLNVHDVPSFHLWWGNEYEPPTPCQRCTIAHPWGRMRRRRAS